MQKQLNIASKSEVTTKQKDADSSLADLTV
jgi:hypothetical protein